MGACTRIEIENTFGNLDEDRKKKQKKSSTPQENCLLLRIQLGHGPRRFEAERMGVRARVDVGRV